MIPIRFFLDEEEESFRRSVPAAGPITTQGRIRLWRAFIEDEEETGRASAHVIPPEPPEPTPGAGGPGGSAFRPLEKRRKKPLEITLEEAALALLEIDDEI